MIIYVPIYLHQNIGFSWNVLGILFAIMLIPYFAFAVPLGALADRKLGEKEILIVGFLLLIITTASMTFLSSQNILMWVGLLFAGRVGATAVETMTETYFFKKIKPERANSLEIFRDARPLAYIVAPLVASLFLAHYELRDLFLLIAIVMTSGIYFSARLTATK